MAAAWATRSREARGCAIAGTSNGIYGWGAASQQPQPSGWSSQFACRSPDHPTADSRRLGQFRPGDVLDGSAVVAADLEHYAGGQTFDLLPAGETGTYIADGVPLVSTLTRR